MYTLLVCADLYGEKCNVELSFPSMPTITELQRKILAVFSSEANLRRPPSYPVVDFTIARVQIYDDVLLKWVDLISPTQLHEYDQLYVFQPQSTWHVDVQKDLPPPCPPSQSRAASAVHSAMSSPQKTFTLSNPPQSHLNMNPNNINHNPASYTSSSYRPEAQNGSINNSAVISPTKMRLEEQRRRERALQEELARIREESERLEREAAIEEEEARAREQEQFNRLLRQKEEEVRRQREMLGRSEEEFRRLQSEKRGHSSTNGY